MQSHASLAWLFLCANQQSLIETDRMSQTEKYHVRLRKDSLVFSAAHFITFNGNVCERLHGHNYAVEIEVEADLDENAYVIDFIALRDTAQKIVGELDHHVLLPTKHEMISVEASSGEVTAKFEDRRWVFPEGDCVLLDISNTTAEMLANYIGGRLIEMLDLGGKIPYRRLSVGVDENCGQWGVWTRDSSSSH